MVEDYLVHAPRRNVLFRYQPDF